MSHPHTEAILCLALELQRTRDQLHAHPPCNCDLTCEDFVTLNRLLCYLRDEHGCEAAWKETIAALARTIRVGETKEHSHG
jgi:hypothetical protein